jgi:hypothetical protein
MIRPGALVRSAYRRLVLLPWLLISARILRYRSKTDRAREKLLRAVAVAPTCFTAHLRLGALYLEEQDFYRAKREFRLARQLNPGKFRRLYPVVTGATGDININLFYFPGFTDREPELAPKDFLREFIGDPLEEQGGFGDFSSLNELRKFQEMGPISIEEASRVDWDEVISRL